MNLKYSDEKDRCYGVTGMVVSLVILEADDMLARVDIDADDNLEFVPEYYFSGNPRLSAKRAWKYILAHYQASMGMIIGNVMCRYYLLHHRAPDSATRKALLESLEQEGLEACSLENDEVKQLFEENYTYLNKVFSHSGVQGIVKKFADDLTASRAFTRGDISERLAALRNL